MDQSLKKRKKLKLYKALKIAYMRGNQKRQAKILKRYGYVLDRDLSNARETLVAYNPFDKKVLMVANGTDIKSEKDLLTDFGLGLGKVRTSERFMDTKSILNKAHEKYKDSNFILAGTSLGGSLVNYAASPKDKVITYNPAFTFNATARPNVTNYRTQGDIISAFAPKENTILLKPKKEDVPKNQTSDSVIYSTLKNASILAGKEGLTTLGVPSIPASAISTAVISAADKLIKNKDNLLKPHKISNIQGAPIYL